MSIRANFISMNPTNTKTAQIILKKLGHVPATVHEVLDKAITAARAFFEMRKLDIDTCLFPNIVRYEAKLLFDSPKYRAAGYHFSVLSNNGLLLIYEYEHTIYRIRVRKADEDGELPTQNLSKTIKEFCRQPGLPFWGVEVANWEAFVCPELVKLFIVWDVDAAFGLTQCGLACPQDEFGNMYFAHEIPHSATAISVESAFDDEAEELEEINVLPLKKTGSKDGGDESDN